MPRSANKRALSPRVDETERACVSEYKVTEGETDERNVRCSITRLHTSFHKHMLRNGSRRRQLTPVDTIVSARVVDSRKQ